MCIFKHLQPCLDVQLQLLMSKSCESFTTHPPACKVHRPIPGQCAQSAGALSNSTVQSTCYSVSASTSAGEPSHISGYSFPIVVVYNCAGCYKKLEAHVLQDTVTCVNRFDGNGKLSIIDLSFARIYVTDVEILLKDCCWRKRSNSIAALWDIKVSQIRPIL